MSPVTRLVHRAEPTKSRRNRVPATLHCFTKNNTSHMTVVESIVDVPFGSGTVCNHDDMFAITTFAAAAQHLLLSQL